MEENILNSFSKHLFWDVSLNKLDLQKSKTFIIKRVLEYGLINDWNLIKNNFGLNVIGKEVKLFKDLDPKSLAFISTVCKIPLNEFRCYTTKQLTPKHWSF